MWIMDIICSSGRSFGTCWAKYIMVKVSPQMCIVAALAPHFTRMSHMLTIGLRTIEIDIGTVYGCKRQDLQSTYLTQDALA